MALSTGLAAVLALGVMGTGAAVAVVTLTEVGGRPQDSALSPGVVVTRVIDGDTLVIADGRRVRLIGIDTPEKDECGYGAATVALRELVEGRRVRLPNPKSVQDQDRYDRLLRYVDIGKADAGFRQVNAGLADARYDGLDGYDRHPRQPRYRAADQAVEGKCEERDRLRRERAQERKKRWEDARLAAGRAGIAPRKGETARHLLRRARSAVAEQRRLAAVAEERRLATLAEQRRQEAERSVEPDPPSSSGGFTPPAGWTTDALTPGYSGCRQGYPGGRINGVYVWKPISC